MENTVIKYRTDNRNSIIVAIIVAVITVDIAVMISTVFQFSLVENLVLGWVLTTLYAVFTMFIIDNTVIKETTRETVRNVPIQVPVENKTIQIVEKPVIKEVPVYIDRVVEKIVRMPARVVRTVKQRAKRLDIPHFKFIGSTQTKRYHTRLCRLGKLIKKKFKIHNNSQAFFKRKHYKKCKVCITHTKKI